MIADEEINMADVKGFINAPDKPDSQIPEKIGEVPVEKLIPAYTGKTEEILEIDEKILKEVDYKLSKCCNPIFGDDIFGFVTISDGIKVHRINCPNAKQMIERFGYRVVKAKWAGTDSKSFFPAGIKLTGGDEIGILSKISDIISKDLKVNLRSINVDTIDGNFEGVITLFVKDVGHLDALIHKLLKVKGVNAATRVETH
jgi:GTP pyrophosphokinase